MVGSDPVRVFAKNRLAQLRKDLGGRIGRPIDFLDAGDGGAADIEDRHA
jgi:hypothetical protein